MWKWLKVGSLSIVGVLVAVALAVGAHSALAKPVMLTCPNDGWRYLGSCSSPAECTNACVGVHGPGAQGKCLDGCCQCLF